MGKRVLDLPSVTTLLGTDVLYAVRPTEASITNYDKKITWADLLTQLGTEYIATDGTTTTTATIPFAQGISITGTNADASAIRIPDGSWIRPQTAGQDIYITRGANPSSVNGVLQLNAGGIVLSHGDGTNQLDRLDLGTANTRLASFSATGVLLDFLQLGNNNISLVTDAGVGLNATSTMMSMFGSTFQLSAGAGDGAYGATGNHLWDSGIAGSTAKYQFNGSAHIASTLRIGSIPTGTQVGLVGYDANGNLIQGTGGGGGSYVTLSGHNDLTTPWSIGDASTWATSSAGIQIDPVGSYGLHLKGNTIIEQAVSQALSLYRPVASGDICLNFDAWDSLGAQSSYAQVCGVVVSNTAGAVGGGLDLEIAIAGVLTPLVQVRQAGSTLVGAWSVTGQLTATGSSGILTNYLHQNNSVNDASLQEIQIFTRGNASGAYYGWNTRGNGAGGTTDLVLRWGGSNVLGFVGNVATFSGFLNGTQRARFGTGADDTVNALQVGGTSNFTGKASFPASVAGSASINIVTGVAVTSPVTGDIWSPSADTMNWRSGANTRTFALREVNQSFSGTQTFSVISATSTITATNTITGRQLAQTRQTSATTTGAITWALGSGGTMDLTAALTGAVTMNITAPSAGAWSALFVTQGATPQTITLSLTGVSWISTGVNGTTGTNTITIPASDFIADKSSCIQIYWSTATRAYVTVT